jgi:hypothetical protein
MITVIYFHFSIPSWANFYIHKMKAYVNILKHLNISVISRNAGQYMDSSLQILDLSTNSETLFLFDELSYMHLLRRFIVESTKSKEDIVKFIKSSKYIIFFSELFENDTLSTIGAGFWNLEFAKTFFSNAYKIMICNTKNITHLNNNNITNNIIYFPPLGYSEINRYVPLLKNDNLPIDVLIYEGSGSFFYRELLREYIGSIKVDNKKINVCRKTDIYGETKDELLKSCKMVVHIPLFSNLHTFPWSKAGELMSKQIFFLIEENEEMYLQKLENTVAFYKRNDKGDLINKITHFITTPDERQTYIDKCFGFVKNNYNMDDLFKNFL